MESREERAAALIWARLADAGARAKPALSIPQIVTSAIQLADADGIDAVSMRKVAGRLGSGTMSLYRHVATRDELIDLMVDAALADEPLPEAADWRAVLVAMAQRARKLYHRHPWLVAYSMGRPAFGPNALDAHEHWLRLLDGFGLGLSLERLLDMTTTVSMFVIGSVAAELADAEAQRRTGLTEEQWREQLAPFVQHLLGTGRYPYYGRIVKEIKGTEPDVEFERRLGYVLDGLATMITR